MPLNSESGTGNGEQRKTGVPVVDVEFCSITNALLPGLLVTTIRSGRVALPVTWPLVIDDGPKFRTTNTSRESRLKLTGFPAVLVFSKIIDRAVGVQDRDVDNSPHRRTDPRPWRPGQRYRVVRVSWTAPVVGLEDGDGGCCSTRREREVPSKLPSVTAICAVR